MEDAFKLSNKVKEKSIVSLSVFNVGRQKCPPDYEWGPGVRDHYLIHYISRGSGALKWHGQLFHLNAGDAFLTRPGEEISYRADRRTPWTYYWVGFAGTDAAQILGATDFSKEMPVLRALPYGEELRCHLEKISDAYGNSFSNALRMTGELCLALALCVENAVPREVLRADDAYVRKAVAYIDSHYSYPISVEEIAAYVGVSRSTLFREFRRVIGIPPKEYLEQFRIRRASFLLRTTDLTIGSVSTSVGYDNGLYFSKAFKKLTGQTPSAYRRARE